MKIKFRILGVLLKILDKYYIKGMRLKDGDEFYRMIYPNGNGYRMVVQVVKKEEKPKEELTKL